MAKRTTIKAGMRGTDNCPVCGQAMHKGKRDLLGQQTIILVCRADDHEVSIRILDKDES